MNTLEALQALSDAELIERVAVEVMLWHKAFFFHDPKEWVWAEYREEQEERTSAMPEWNPIADWNETMEVVQSMKDWCKRYLFSEHAARIVLSDWPGNVNASHFYDGVATGLCDMDQRTICFAALLAVSPA